MLIKTVKSAVMEEMRNQNAVSAPEAGPSTLPDDYYDFGESIEVEQAVDHASKATLEILQFFEHDCRDMELLDKYANVRKVFFRHNTPVLPSAPVERLFSYATMTNCPKRNRTTAKLFEKRVTPLGGLRVKGLRIVLKNKIF